MIEFQQGQLQQQALQLRKQGKGSVRDIEQKTPERNIRGVFDEKTRYAPVFLIKSQDLQQRG
jgi:hypothetical protein